jgi:hypothetical protein
MLAQRRLPGLFNALLPLTAEVLANDPNLHTRFDCMN